MLKIPTLSYHVTEQLIFMVGHYISSHENISAALGFGFERGVSFRYVILP